MKILIADDSAVSLGFLKGILTNWGYEVVTCEDGNEAWNEIQKEDAPNIAILDWSMPGMDGVDICRAVRKKGLHRYILMLTAKDSTDDIVVGREAGADDYICKPFKQEEMELRLRAGERIIRLRSQLEEANIKPVA